MDRYNELVDLLNKANYEYHVLDNPETLTDEEYDNYLREVYEMEEKFSWFNVMPAGIPFLSSAELYGYQA